MRIKEIAERVGKASKGPWEFDMALSRATGSYTRAVYHRRGYEIIEIVESPDEPDGECIHQSDADAEFIAHSREDTPYLLSRLRELAGAAGGFIDKCDAMAPEINDRLAHCEVVRGFKPLSQNWSAEHKTLRTILAKLKEEGL